MELEMLWASISPLQNRAKQHHDDQPSKDIEALLSSIAVICDRGPNMNDAIKTVRVLLSLGHPQAASEKCGPFSLSGTFAERLTCT
ncbi:hypothetical protein PAMC26510_08225 [Caballeronia sordidicola]|uniref:Uncharacterized protein n=1 Tax=Caballeronia sordidicola TaxID=196367 RepID=A0A242N2N4_CABSO|nr:hypothetical protein PAMC26510_08225 [Caballeronia sordidicola]